jgi:hypothetical protein
VGGGGGSCAFHATAIGVSTFTVFLNEVNVVPLLSYIVSVMCSVNCVSVFSLWHIFKLYIVYAVSNMDAVSVLWNR